MRRARYVWVLVFLLAGVATLLVYSIESDSAVRHDRGTSSAASGDPVTSSDPAPGATRPGDETHVDPEPEPRLELSGVARTDRDKIPSPPLKIIATTRRLPEHDTEGPLPVPDLPAEIQWGFWDHTRVPDGSFSIGRLPRGTYRLVTDSNYWAIDPPVHVEAGQTGVVVRVVPTFGLHARVRDQDTGEDVERFSLRVRAEGEKPGEIFERVVEGTAGLCQVRWRLPEWAPRGLISGRPVLFRRWPQKRDVLFEIRAPGCLTWRTYTRHSAYVVGEKPYVVFPRENRVVAWLLRDRPDNFVLAVTMTDGRPYDGKLMGTYSKRKPKFEEPLAMVCDAPGLYRAKLPKGRQRLAIRGVPTFPGIFQFIDVDIDETGQTHASLQLPVSAVVTVRRPDGPDQWYLSGMRDAQRQGSKVLREATTRFRVQAGAWRFELSTLRSNDHIQNIDVVAGGEYIVETPDR